MNRCQSYGFKTRLLGRDFQTFINNISFLSPTDVGSHIPSLEPHALALNFAPMLLNSKVGIFEGAV